MDPQKALPFPPIHACVEDYVEALLEFVTTSDVLQTLCGGVHILDFLTRDPDLFEAVLPPEWRSWLRLFEIPDILDLLMREDLDGLLETSDRESMSYNVRGLNAGPRGSTSQWRGGPLPPKSLLIYILQIRNLSLDRSFAVDGLYSEIPKTRSLSRQIAVGMKPKKAHEVENFAAFVASFVTKLASSSSHRITHLVDFGSGQNYLGRVLASPTYGKRVVAVESKQANINGAKDMDISAKLAKKTVTIRNKKTFRMQQDGLRTLYDERAKTGKIQPVAPEPRPEGCGLAENTSQIGPSPDKSFEIHGLGSIQYVEHVIKDGDLKSVVSQLDVHNITKERDIWSAKEYNGKPKYLLISTSI